MKKFQVSFSWEQLKMLSIALQAIHPDEFGREGHALHSAIEKIDSVLYREYARRYPAAGFDSEPAFVRPGPDKPAPKKSQLSAWEFYLACCLILVTAWGMGAYALYCIFTG